MYIGNCLSPDHKKYCIRLSLVGPSYPYHVPAFTTFHPLSIYFKLFASCTQFFLSRLFDSAYLFYLSSSPLFAPSSPSSLPLPPIRSLFPSLRSLFAPSSPSSLLLHSLFPSFLLFTHIFNHFLGYCISSVVCKVLFIN